MSERIPNRILSKNSPFETNDTGFLFQATGSEGNVSGDDNIILADGFNNPVIHCIELFFHSLKGDPAFLGNLQRGVRHQDHLSA